MAKKLFSFQLNGIFDSLTEINFQFFLAILRYLLDKVFLIVK